MATKIIAWQTGSGNITLTYQGQGDGPISVQSDANDIGSARSQTIIIQTTKGGLVTKNVTVSQAACPFPVGDVRNFAYTGNVQSVVLPAGKYKLQCWGAQGGSNAAASSYGITAKAGGKGGYSEGVLTLTSKTTVRIYVGGAGSSSAGGFNGGGSTSGSSSYSSGDVYGVSRMGGGGGATDIRLSDGTLLSRMIVAGGGSGGAMCYKAETTTTQVDVWENSGTVSMSGFYKSDRGTYFRYFSGPWWDNMNGKIGRVTITGSPSFIGLEYELNNGSHAYETLSNGSKFTFRASDDWRVVQIYVDFPTDVGDSQSITYESGYISTETSTSTSNSSQVGFAGGGTTGGGYSSTYQGKQSAAGSGGSFGQGANQSATNYRYCSGAGGGGWYGGGGGQYSDSSMTTCRYSGGGSGWVNIAANASYRPSGYTGLQLDSGETKAGNTSFPSTSGGTEAGHSGNGYAKITRLS